MDKFEYVVALASVITGLGLSNVAVNLHHLLKRRARVVWDWLPLTLATYASFVLMRLWYQLWSVREVPLVTDPPFIAVQVVQTLVLVLVASAALPDEADYCRGRVDLRAYYATHGRYVWSLYLGFILMWVATGLFFVLRAGAIERLADPRFHTFFSIPLVLTVIAVTVGRRGQAVILVMLVAHEILIPLNLLGLR